MTAVPSIAVLSFLLNAGAPLNGTTQRGDTCLHYAVMAGHEEAARFLLQQVRACLVACNYINLSSPLSLQGADVHARSESGTVLELVKSSPALAPLFAHFTLPQHAELHASRGMLLTSTGVGEHAGLEQHEDGEGVVTERPSSPLRSPVRPPNMRLLRDGLLRLLYSGSRKQDVYLGLFTDGLVIGFSEPIGPRFVLQRAMYMPSTSVFDLPPLSDDWRHCFVLTNVERVRCCFSWLSFIPYKLGYCRRTSSSLAQQQKNKNG